MEFQNDMLYLIKLLIGSKQARTLHCLAQRSAVRESTSQDERQNMRIHWGQHQLSSVRSKHSHAQPTNSVMDQFEKQTQHRWRLRQNQTSISSSKWASCHEASENSSYNDFYRSRSLFAFVFEAFCTSVLPWVHIGAHRSAHESFHAYCCSS